jgi:hypothetical protein
MVHAKYLPLLLVVLMLPGAMAVNETFSSYCPKVTCVNQTFAIWGDYRVNGSVIYNATVNVTIGPSTYPLTYNPIYEDYRDNFTISMSQVVNYTIQAPNFTQNCSTEAFVCYTLTIKLWQEKEYKIYANTSQYAVRVRNYDKQLNTPYINDFAYIIARAGDHAVPGLNNDSCNLPTGPGQQILDYINLGNWMGTKTSNSIINLIGGVIGCDNFWFKAKLVNGQADIQLPWAGNFSLYLLDGTMVWHGEYSPPDIVKSNLFMPLGEETIPTKADYTDNFWISHAELNFWGPIMDTLFIPLLIIGLFIFAALIIFGVTGITRAFGITLIWWVLWTIIRIL